ncbi:MAG: ATP-binding cassette domain-containing protein [Devosia sp.]|uniref:ATP-binding cassette domain-containing protein n=1 Tax=Devosia sp. TaxID=1871048 RepID=UPI0024CCD995|nr:ATP-binding cassette domain-containing protein [Devosia sp.]UYN98222.1 MAG: ATP-binding cassette domain-containing protein [Devosia sp.]
MLTADRMRFVHEGQSEGYEFSFAAEPGVVTAISGASGSGKSTLLDLVAGFLKPMSGSLVLDGVDLLPLPPEGRPVSLLLQADNLFDHLSADDNVRLGLPRNAGQGAGQLISNALTEVGLGRVEKQLARTLSGGQKQRVALARTLLRARPVLLLDEPFSALDDETRIAMRQTVGELTQRHGWHTLLVSHHLDDIAALAGRHYRIEQGKLLPA